VTTGLTGIRVLEVANGLAAAYAGRLLAMYGADVVKAEPPQGDLARSFDLLGDGAPDPEANPLFLFLNAGKRSVMLDFTTDGGRDRLWELTRSADVLLEDLALPRL
jgi:crotonobetainyl-CoA:carnitine CoA-transferase CaiB-like acyl-CoA transferase